MLKKEPVPTHEVDTFYKWCSEYALSGCDSTLNK